MRTTTLIVVLACGCAQATPPQAMQSVQGGGLEVPQDARVKPSTAPPADEPEVAAAAPEASSPALPRQLECISAIEVAAGRQLSSFRASVALDSADAFLTLDGGPRFQSHAGEWTGAPNAASRRDTLHATGPRTFAGGAAEDPVGLVLQGEGPFFTAVLSLASEVTELVCWDRIAIFGSSWSNRPTALARYDASTGACVDAEGQEAPLEDLPLEFVLEAGHGECADLRGALLNAGDFAQPNVNLDLRGADLTDASLYHATLDGSFEGARLGAFVFGYVELSGTIDDATELPASTPCEVSEDTWAGMMLSCRN